MTAIKHHSQIRTLVERLIAGVSEEELFRVPEGFANHLAWNAGHVIATQQILQYRLSGIQPIVPDELIDAYKKGTGPAATTPDSYRAIIEFLHRTPEYLQRDYDRGLFKTFTTYETSTGIVLHNIDDAILFNNMHEGIHIGYMMAMNRALGKK